MWCNRINAVPRSDHVPGTDEVKTGTFQPMRRDAHPIGKMLGTIVNVVSSLKLASVVVTRQYDSERSSLKPKHVKCADVLVRSSAQVS